jgi:hypothetical protein
MQSLEIKRPAERSSRVIASAILIDCPAAAAAAAIPSGYFVSAVSTDSYLYYSRSIPLLDLFYCWICYAAQLFRPTVLLLPLLLLLLLFRLTATD